MYRYYKKQKFSLLLTKGVSLPPRFGYFPKSSNFCNEDYIQTFHAFRLVVSIVSVISIVSVVIVVSPRLTTTACTQPKTPQNFKCKVLRCLLRLRRSRRGYWV